MPCDMRGYVQSVAVQEMMYVGGGLCSYAVAAYNTQSQTWHWLPQHATQGYAMVIINNKLVLVGGLDSSEDDTNTLVVWEAGRRQWTHPYESMPTPRSGPSAVVYKKWLIVAGGSTGFSKISTIEVLDIPSNQWNSAPPAPTPWSEMRSAIIGDMCYFMGGYDYTDGAIEMVYSVSLPSLVSQTTSTRSTHYPMWKTISTLEHTLSVPLSIGGELLAVGGEKNGKRVSDIHHYLPETNEWVVVGHTPSSAHGCSCTLISDGHIPVLGVTLYYKTTFYLGSLV